MRTLVEVAGSTPRAVAALRTELELARCTLVEVLARRCMTSSIAENSLDECE